MSILSVVTFTVTQCTCILNTRKHYGLTTMIQYNVFSDVFFK